MEPNHRYVPVESKIVVNLFSSDVCQTSNLEAERVRTVCGEFGAPPSNEYCAEDRNAMLCHQFPLPEKPSSMAPRGLGM